MRSQSLTIEHGLLGFLRDGPKHGYAIHQLLADPGGLGSVWQIKLSRLYALLGKLEAAGLVYSTSAAQENKPPRKLFHLTAVGGEAFGEWVQQPVAQGRALRLEFLVKLYFARQEGSNVAARLLAKQRELCHAWLNEQKKEVAAEVAAGWRYSRLVRQFRLGQLEAMLVWLAHCAEE